VVKVIAATVLATVILAPPAWACPNCKDNFAAQGPNGQNLARGFYWSILFMMGMPFALLGGFSGYMYLEVRRARERAARDAASTAAAAVAPPQACAAPEAPQ
jgi:hypothetical protein